MLELQRDYGDYRIYVESITANLPEVMAMWQSHWNEQGEEELRTGAKLNPDIEHFERMQGAGLFHYITVRKGDELVGHFGLGLGKNRQTSELVAGDEFFYLKPEHRKGMLAVKLIKFAKGYAFNLGAKEFSVSYRVSVDDLDPLLRRCGMHSLARVYTARR